MKYYIITFGCQMNQSDSERIALVLEKKGYRPASKKSEADLIVVNMCSIRQSAVDRVYGQIKNFAKLKNQNPKLKTILTGCILKSDRRKFRKKFDSILEFRNLNILPKRQDNSNALIPISNGCNNFCSYCVVPFTRGSLVCRSHKDILKEVKRAISNKAKQIWLLGQNVNDYRSPVNSLVTELPKEAKVKMRTEFSSINFPKLLKMVNNVSGNFRINFISPNPKDFSDELIDVMASLEKIDKYLNLPVQSGDNEILKKMRRPYTVEKYKNLVKKIRKKIPEIALSTDIIVGFPGETRKQFQNTVKLFKEIKFNMAYISKYSPRPGTIAFQMKDNVPLEEKKRREKLLRDVLNYEKTYCYSGADGFRKIGVGDKTL